MKPHGGESRKGRTFSCFSYAHLSLTPLKKKEPSCAHFLSNMGQLEASSLNSCLVFQPGVVGQMLEAAEERPWLWVVYILTVALPVFLVILFCCSGKVGVKSSPDVTEK